MVERGRRHAAGGRTPRSPASRPRSRACRSRRCSRATTTAATRSSRSARAPGGTDAQDWTEMLLRMYERWAERRGFDFEVLDATPGEEAGLKSAMFRVHGRERLRRARRRARRAPPGAPQPVRLGPPPPDELRAGRRGARAAARRSDRDRRQRSAHRHVPLLGRRRTARQQDRLRRAHHAPADRHRRAVPERALAAREQGHGDARAQEPPARARGGGEAGRAAARAGILSDNAFGSQIRSLRPAPVHDGQRSPLGSQGRQRARGAGR